MIRRALAFADRLSESVGESRTRRPDAVGGATAATNCRWSSPTPTGFIGRVDFFFPEYGTVVEFDGLVKYGDGSREALIQEKLREDRLRALGLEVVRITWQDLDDPPRTAATIRRAFARARRTSA